METIRRGCPGALALVVAVAAGLGACAPAGQASAPADVEVEENVASVEQQAVCEDCEPGGGGGGGGGPTSPYPIITFWEDNHCGGDQVGWFGATYRPIVIPNASGSGWENDEARSMRLFNIPQGTRFKICNSPTCGTNESWSVVRVDKDITDRCVYSFESAFGPYQDDYVLEEVHGSPLDGKVSRVEVYGP